jgi:hypothetical protein
VRRAALLAGLAVLASCGSARPPDTAPVPLAQGTGYSVVGQRLGGRRCAALVVEGQTAPLQRCGHPLRKDRRWDVGDVVVGQVQVVYAPMPPAAVRVRLDTSDGFLREVEARSAPGFPGRFFVLELPPDLAIRDVRAFAAGGRELYD